MSWRDNWLLALPPVARLFPPLLLAVLGGAGLIWLHDRAPGGMGANAAPLVWFTVGVGLLVRPAQPLVISATALGMAGLAAHGAVDTTLGLDRDLWRPSDSLRVALWSALALLALPAAVREALGSRPVLARRLYFAAVTLFFLEQGLRRAMGVSGRPAEAVFFLLVASVGCFAVVVADRTIARPSRPAPPGEETEVASPRPVRYLDENPPSLPETPRAPR